MLEKSIRWGTIISRGLFFGRLLQSRITNKPSPLLVTFSLTPRCNFDCTYCYGDYKSRRYKGKEITTISFH